MTTENEEARLTGRQASGMHKRNRYKTPGEAVGSLLDEGKCVVRILNAEFLAAAGGALTVGGAARGVWVQFFERMKRLEERLEAERARSEATLRGQIDELRSEIRQQDGEITWLRGVNEAYMRHSLRLEAMVVGADLTVPEIELPERPHTS